MNERATGIWFLRAWLLKKRFCNLGNKLTTLTKKTVFLKKTFEKERTLKTTEQVHCKRTVWSQV